MATKSAETKKAGAAAKSSTKSKGVTLTEGRGRSKVREGTVVSDKMTKTIVVEVSRLEQHPIYKKYIHKSKKYYAHDESEQASIGDLVKIVETRPMSKLKHWKLQSIVRKSDPTLAKVDDAAV